MLPSTAAAATAAGRAAAVSPGSIAASATASSSQLRAARDCCCRPFPAAAACGVAAARPPVAAPPPCCYIDGEGRVSPRPTNNSCYSAEAVCQGSTGASPAASASLQSSRSYPTVAAAEASSKQSRRNVPVEEDSALLQGRRGVSVTAAASRRQFHSTSSSLLKETSSSPHPHLPTCAAPSAIGRAAALLFAVSSVHAATPHVRAAHAASRRIAAAAFSRSRAALRAALSAAPCLSIGTPVHAAATQTRSVSFAVTRNICMCSAAPGAAAAALRAVRLTSPSSLFSSSYCSRSLAHASPLRCGVVTPAAALSPTSALTPAAALSLAAALPLAARREEAAGRGRAAGRSRTGRRIERLTYAGSAAQRRGREDKTEDMSGETWGDGSLNAKAAAAALEGRGSGCVPYSAETLCHGVKQRLIAAAGPAAAAATAAAGEQSGSGARYFSWASPSVRHPAAAGGKGRAAAATPGGWGARSTLLSFLCRGICVVTGFGFAYSFANPDEDTVYEVFPLQQQHRYAFLAFYRVQAASAADFEQRIKNLSRFYQKQQVNVIHGAIDLLSLSKTNHMYIPELITFTHTQRVLPQRYQAWYLFTRLLRAESLASSSGSGSEKKEDSKEKKDSSSCSDQDTCRYYMQISTWLTVDDYLLASGKPMAQQLTTELPTSGLASTPILYENVADDTRYTPTAASAASLSHPAATASGTAHAPAAVPA